MIVYHGTTIQRARRICREGLQPKPPSRRVWFAEDRKYAFQRAKTWAHRTNDRAIVLTADVDLARLRKQLGPSRIIVVIVDPGEAQKEDHNGTQFGQKLSTTGAQPRINRWQQPGTKLLHIYHP